MNRTHTFLTAALIALPFLLLPAGIWLANTAAQLWYIEAAPYQPWQGVRWLMRALYVGGAILGWRARRPIWFYPWLSFAVYEAVAVLMLLVVGILARFWNTYLGDGPTSLLGAAFYLLGAAFYLLFVSFSPSLAVNLWPGRPPLQRLLAAYIAFPPAALTFPLISAAVIEKDAGGMPRGMMQLAMEGMPPLATLVAAVCAATFAIVFWRPPLALLRGRANLAQKAVLTGGVPLCHFLYLTILIVHSFGEEPDYTGDLWIYLVSVGLGWLILSGPLLLPTLLQLPARLLKSNPGMLLRAAVRRNC